MVSNCIKPVSEGIFDSIAGYRTVNPEDVAQALAPSAAIMAALSMWPEPTRLVGKLATDGFRGYMTNRDNANGMEWLQLPGIDIS